MPPDIDFERHNEEQAAVWEAFQAGRPLRPPMILGLNPRYTMCRPEANPSGIQFDQYSTDPRSMLHRQVEHIWWVRHNLLQDVEMGPPTDGFHAYLDLQNYSEAAWFGAEVVYRAGQVPDTRPLLTDDRRNLLFDQGPPDPFRSGIMARMWSMREEMQAIAASGFEYRGLPVLDVAACGLGTDGPMTVCCNLRGADGFCADLGDDSDYADRLLEFVTEATISRIRAFRERLGQDARPQGLGFADDSIQLISTEMYVQRIMPHHRRLIDELSQGGPNSLHLCGDATRHFSTIAASLNVTAFDTGFPVDFAWLDRALPKSVTIYGGPSVPFLQTARPGDVRTEVRRILETGISRGRKMVVREGNNLAPDVTPEICAEMYHAVRELGPEYV